MSAMIIRRKKKKKRTNWIFGAGGAAGADSYKDYAVFDGSPEFIQNPEVENLLKAADDLTNGTYWIVQGITVTEPSTGVFRLTKTAAINKNIQQTLTNWLPAWTGTFSAFITVSSDDLTELSVGLLVDGLEAVTEVEVVSGNASVSIAGGLGEITGIDGSPSVIRITSTAKAWAASVVVRYFVHKFGTTAGYVDASILQIVLGDQVKPRPVGQEVAYPIMAWRPNWRLTGDEKARYSVVDTEGLVSIGEADGIAIAPTSSTAFDCSPNCTVLFSYTCEDTKYSYVRLRYADGDNYFEFGLTGGRQLRIRNRVDASTEELHTSAALTDAEFYRFRATLVGSTYKIYQDDKLLYSGSVSDAGNNLTSGGTTATDIATNDIKIVTEPYPKRTTSIIVAGGKAAPADGDPRVTMTETDGSAFAADATKAALVTWTPFNASGAVYCRFGFDSNTSGNPAGTHFGLVGDTWNMYIAAATFPQTVVSGTEYSHILYLRSNTNGHHGLSLESGKQWKRLWTDTGALADAGSDTAYVAFTNYNTAFTIQRIALLDFSPIASADFAEVTDSKTAPVSAATYLHDSDAHVNSTFTFEATKIYIINMRYIDDDNRAYIYAQGAGGISIVDVVDGDSTILYQASGVFSDGVTYELDAYFEGENLTVALGKVNMYSGGGMTVRAVATGGTVVHSLVTNDIVITTHPNPALGGDVFGATDRVICPQAGDTAIHEDESFINWRTFQLDAGDNKRDKFRKTDGTNAFQVTSFGDGRLQYHTIVGGAFVLITGGAAGTVTDDDNVTATVWKDGSTYYAELFVNGASIGSADVTVAANALPDRQYENEHFVADAVELWPSKLDAITP